MALNLISSRIGSVLALIAIGLALANWNARPGAALAWAAVIVISVVMVAVQRLSQVALSRSPHDAAWVRGVASVDGAVVFGALMMIIPLALTLAHAYGLVDDPDSGMRRTDHDHDRRVPGRDRQRHAQDAPADIVTAVRRRTKLQAFQRQAGWTWVLCGLGLAIAGLALPIDAQTPISVALVATAMIVTIVQLLRLRKPQPHAPRLN